MIIKTNVYYLNESDKERKERKTKISFHIGDCRGVMKYPENDDRSIVLINGQKEVLDISYDQMNTMYESYKKRSNKTNNNEG